MQERRVVNEAGVTGFFSKVYTTMGLGLGVTALVSWLLASVFQTQYLNFLGNHGIMAIIVLLLPMFLSFGVSSRRAQANTGYASMMFFLMSAAWGFTFSLIAMAYSGAYIAIALVTTAVVFITMSAVGRNGKRDLTKPGTFASAALIGIILLSVVNMFMHSSGVELLISYAILIVFIVLTAFDTQRLKRLYMTATGSGSLAINENTLAVQGALMLYLDFLNLFTAILQIFGMGGDRN